MESYTIVVELTDEQELMLQRIAAARDRFRRKNGDYNGEDSVKADILEHLVRADRSGFITRRLEAGLNIFRDYLEDEKPQTITVQIPHIGSVPNKKVSAKGTETTC